MKIKASMCYCPLIDNCPDHPRCPQPRSNRIQPSCPIAPARHARRNWITTASCRSRGYISQLTSHGSDRVTITLPPPRISVKHHCVGFRNAQTGASTARSFHILYEKRKTSFFLSKECLEITTDKTVKEVRFINIMNCCASAFGNLDLYPKRAHCI